MELYDWGATYTHCSLPRANNPERAMRLWRKPGFVQLISLSRIFATLTFASLAFAGTPRSLLSLIYLFAGVTDWLDGHLSRAQQTDTPFGKVLDLVADKSLTIVSLMYAAASGINILPLSFISVREVVMLGMRLVVVDDGQLLPTSRTFGGVMALLVWGNTLLLINAVPGTDVFRVVSYTYWLCALLFTGNLFVRLIASSTRIKSASAARE